MMSRIIQLTDEGDCHANDIAKYIFIGCYAPVQSGVDISN